MKTLMKTIPLAIFCFAANLQAQDAPKIPHKSVSSCLADAAESPVREAHLVQDQHPARNDYSLVLTLDKEGQHYAVVYTNVHVTPNDDGSRTVEDTVIDSDQEPVPLNIVIPAGEGSVEMEHEGETLSFTCTPVE